MDSNAEAVSLTLNAGDFVWLLGTWLYDTEEAVMFEKWIMIDEYKLRGISYQVIEGDTMMVEIMTIKATDNDAYLGVRTGPAEGDSATFGFKSLDLRSFTFENLNHDFPQRISYEQPNEDSIFASIGGNLNGKETTIPFFMQRVAD